MTSNEYFMPLYDQNGNLYAVMLSAEIWAATKKEIEPHIKNALAELDKSSTSNEIPEPMNDWHTFLQYWDFKYPIDATVECVNCKQKTADWILDPEKPFRLRSAQLGGLVVFDCKECGSIVRKKHFKDHYCFECTTKK